LGEKRRESQREKERERERKMSEENCTGCKGGL